MQRKNRRPNERLRHARELRGWGQKDVAKRLGLLDERSIRRWESGESVPSPYYRQQLCELFGVNALELGFLDKTAQIASAEQSYAAPLLVPQSELLFSVKHLEDAIEEPKEQFGVPNTIQEEAHLSKPREEDLSQEEDVSEEQPDALLEEQRTQKEKDLANNTPHSENAFSKKGHRRTFLTIGASLAGAGILGVLLKHFFTTPIGTTLYISMENGNIEATTWSPAQDIFRVACASTDNNIYVWDAFTGNHFLIYNKHQKAALGIAWSPDGTLLASASADATVQIWEASTGNAVSIYTGHQQDVHDVDWSPNGKLLASASSDATVHIWEKNTSRLLLRYQHNASVASVKWSPDGKKIVSGSVDGVLQIWDIVHKKQLFKRATPDEIFTVAWSHDGKYIASAGNKYTYEVDVWDAQTATIVYIYRGHSNVVRRIAWSPDGQRLASASFDKTVHVWDAFSGTYPYVYRQHSDWVVGLAWSPDGSYLASGSYDQTARVWTARDN